MTEQQKQLKQFTFYELYEDILNCLTDTQAGKMANRICAYEFDDVEPTGDMTDEEKFYWENLSEMLHEVKDLEKEDKIPKKYNYKSKHFTFLPLYYRAMKLLNVTKCGIFVKGICRYIKHGIIKHNPLDMVFHSKHEREHGTALTKEEEKKLLAETAGTPYQQMFAVGLYTGMRPNEYYTAKVEGDFIVANNSKRKNGKTELKKIPITPMLAPYIKDGDELKFYRLEQIRHKFNGILPRHKLYDLRTTFYTRCTECGIAEAAIKKYVGHTLGGLADTYTDLSDEFLLAEGKKFVY